MMTLPRIPQGHVISAIKALSYFGIVVIIFLVFRIQGQNHRIAEQAKSIAQQNNKIARENNAHIDCIAALFARYTRDNRPITIKSLDKCTADRTELSDDSSPTTTAPGLTNQNTNDSNSQKPSNSKNPTKRGPGNPPRKVMGIPLCAPDPLGLIEGGACIREDDL